ncbi:MAG: alpha/beta hydrolase [Cyanobacteria bacterium P01_F01_bin.33]
MFVPPGFQQKYVTTKLGQIAYYVADNQFWTDDRPAPEQPMVFLHGFGGGSSAYEWSQVYPAFATEYQVFAPDLLGWGRSAHLQRDYTVDDYLSTIPEILEQTCSCPAIVVASSLTGAMVVRVAIARPELFRALILTAPAGLSDFGVDYSRTFISQLISTPVLDRVLYRSVLATEFGIRSFLENRQFVNRDRVVPEIIKAYLASAEQPDAEYSALSFVRGDLCFDLADYIETLGTPTAILWGRQSNYTAANMGRRLAEMNPDAIRCLKTLDNVGLTPHLELPAIAISIMRQFLTVLLK